MLKTADQILVPALARLYELRPTTFKHLNDRTGRYWHVFAAHRAQAAAELQRLAKLIASNSLSCSGQDLIDYIASEYTELPDIGGSKAIGDVIFSRTVLPSSVAGKIPKGTRITREENSATEIPVAAAQYETLEDVHFNATQGVTGPVRIRALTASYAANHPLRTDSVAYNISATSLFDNTIFISAFNIAGGVDPFNFTGGSAGANEDFLREFAKAYARGQYGPTQDESKFAALHASGVRHTVIYDDVPTGSQRILIADDSWASSGRWAAAVQQSIYDSDLVGFGCQVQVVPVRNKVVSLEANIVLRSWDYTKETTVIHAAVENAIKRYFDNRPDWNVWKARGLRNAITTAHPKILHCTSVVVRDVTGAALNEIATVDYSTEQFHYYSAGVTGTYVGPG